MFKDLSLHIRSHKRIPHTTVLRLLHWLHPAERRREIGNSIIPDAGTYLHWLQFSPLISARRPDDEVLAQIAARKAYVLRCEELLPEIFSLLAISTDEALQSAMHLIDDCCHGYPLVLKSERKKTHRAKVLRQIESAESQLKDLRALINGLEDQIGIEFDHHMEATNSLYHRTEIAPTFDRLMEQLGSLQFICHLALEREKFNKSRLYFSDNRAKTHIVICAYDLALLCNTPQVVTTPGSDFSVLCGLLLELAGGERDASLAGAINRFLRSPERQEMDAENRQFLMEQSDEWIEEYGSDNFVARKEESRELSAELRDWKELLAGANWSTEEETQIHIRINDVIKKSIVAYERYGPNLIWASQLPMQDDNLSDIHEDLLELEAKLGRYRRSRKLT